MMPCRRTGNTGPDLPEKSLEASLGQQAERSRSDARFPVAARLPLHQDELDVILDHGVGLVRFAQEATGPSLHFVRRVGDLVPDYGRQVVEPQCPAPVLNGGVQRNHGMPATVPAPR